MRKQNLHLSKLPYCTYCRFLDIYKLSWYLQLYQCSAWDFIYMYSFRYADISILLLDILSIFYFIILYSISRLLVKFYSEIFVFYCKLKVQFRRIKCSYLYTESFEKKSTVDWLRLNTWIYISLVLNAENMNCVTR